MIARRAAPWIGLLLLSLAGCTTGERSPPHVARVAVYVDAGAWDVGSRSIVEALEREGFSVARLSARDVGKGLDGFDGLVVPGGNGWEQWHALGDDGLVAIRSFVRGGGSYVGVCAGAYLATDEVRWEEEGVTDYPLDLLDGRAVGALDEIAPWPRVGATRLELTGAGRARGLEWPAEETFFYQGGPRFESVDDAVVLATYPDGEPAIVGATYGKGRVTLTAVHFERPVGVPNSAPAPAEAGKRFRRLLGL